MGSLFASLGTGPAGPLHVLPPWFHLALKVALAAVVITAVILIFLRLAKQKKPLRKARPRPYAYKRKGKWGIYDKINFIRQNHLDSQNYRQGCHELSSEMKTYFESVTYLQVEEMTAREIEWHLGQEVGAFFKNLCFLQFELREPSRKEFNKICDRALNIYLQARPQAGRGYGVQ